MAKFEVFIRSWWKFVVEAVEGLRKDIGKEGYNKPPIIHKGRVLALIDARFGK